MIRLIIAKFQGLARNHQGGLLVFIALSLLPMLLMMGLAVDSSIGMGQKHELQAAVDAAAKAGAANGNGQTATITSEAQKIFIANTANMKNITGPTISVNSSAKTVTVSASIAVSNIFMSLGGISTSTYSATSTASITTPALAEIAIVYEVSARFANSNFHQNVCTALINYVNSLPSNVMVSITPIATEFLVDSTLTVPSTLFSHLSMTATDELANPAFYPLSSSLAWTTANYNTVSNPIYTSNTFDILTSYPSPSTCPGNYASCSTYMWPLQCPSSKKTSCSQVYSYISNPAFPVLPLTLNKTMIVTYLQNLKAYSASSNGFFPSLISWGWRTIDPSWKDFWLVNSSATTTARAAGTYPNPYTGAKQKSMILIFNGTPYWDGFVNDVAGYYNNTCGNAATVVGGVNHWWMSGYGMVPVPTENQPYVNDITCQNAWYKTMDKVLGLSLTDSTNYNATVNISSFQNSVLSAVSSKFFRICTNIKAQGVNIYLLSSSGTSTLSPCCNSSANAYTISNSSSSIATALNAVQTKIAAQIS